MLRVLIRRLLPSLLLALLAVPALANVVMEGYTPRQLFPEARFDPAIPTQQQVLGIQHGARPLRHAELMRYLEALDDASPRARLEIYARSHEGRELVTFAVSDEATMGRLEAFRAEHAARVDPRGRSAGDDAAALDDAKAVAWIAYGIHGDELSSVDAAAAVAYRLVAGEDERAAMLRRELVILIDPMENPDGRDRYLSQTRAFAHKVPSHDRDDLSHTAIWPWGRGNHYLFDLNRDWFSMVHPESERSAVIASWEPQLMVDAHEMGANNTYLFSPPRHPFNPLLPPSHREWWDRFAADQARALDARGYPYYTREWNEEFFPGYGSSWAAYRGALGILYEMSRTSGTLVKKRSGDMRNYAEATEHQVASSMANLETLAANRKEILLDYVADRRETVDAAEGAWVLPEGDHPERTRELVRLLRRQGIEVEGVEGGTGRPRIEGLRDAQSGAPVAPDALPERIWVVRLDQPAARLARVLLDPHVPMEAPFFREEREHLERGRGSRLYDTTAWSLPFCYGVESYWTRELPDADLSREAEPQEPAGSVETRAGAVAYLVDGDSDRSVGALADLLQREIRVRVAEKPFAVSGEPYRRGALLIRVEGNPDDLAAQLEQVAERWSVRIRAVGTGKAEQGPDLGGQHFPSLREPRVGILAGPGIGPTNYGALWHLMDEVLALRFSAIDASRMRFTDLDRYNVLVLPQAFGGYRAILGAAGIEKLAGWVRNGGTLIGIGSGASFLADSETGLTRTRLRRQALDRYPPVVLGPGGEAAQTAGLFRAVGLRAPESSDEAETDDGKKKKSPRGLSPKGTVPSASPRGQSPSGTVPYDVAPILGPGAAPFAQGHDQGTPADTLPVDLADWLKPFLPPGQSAPDEEQLERADERLRRFMPRGAFLLLELDPKLWLSWGVTGEVPLLPALTDASDALVAEPPVEVAARFADLPQLHLGGLLWPEGAGRIAQTAYVTRERVERGQVILFLNDPEFRAWTLGTRRLLANAILYGPGLGTSWSRPW